MTWRRSGRERSRWQVVLPLALAGCLATAVGSGLALADAAEEGGVGISRNAQARAEDNPPCALETTISPDRFWYYRALDALHALAEEEPCEHLEDLVLSYDSYRLVSFPSDRTES